jgi:hypothetical protein
MAVLRQEHQREWFDDLVQSQFWFHQLIRYCDRSQLTSLQAAAAHLDLHIARLVSAENYGTKGFSILEVLQDSIAVVEASARAEYEHGRPVRRVQPAPGGPGQTQAIQGNGHQIVMSSARGDIFTQRGDASRGQWHSSTGAQINIAMASTITESSLRIQGA